MSVKRCLLFIFLFVTREALGQDADIFKPNPHRRELRAERIFKNLKIDALLDEPEWALTKGASDFIQAEPYQGKPSGFATIVKVLNGKTWWLSAP